MPVYLSASSISDFIRCPQKVLYRIKKTVPQVQSKEMMVGNVAHYAIQYGWNDRDKAKKLVISESDKYGLKKPERVHLDFMVDIFFLNFRHYLSDHDEIEFNFKIPLYDDVFIVGKMDRIIHDDVFDWKTSAKLPNSLSNDVQCMIYSWAYEKLHGAKPSSVNVAGLATGELIPYMEDTLCTKEIFENVIPRMIRTIRHDSYERLGMFNHSCFRCPYKQGCLGGKEDVMDYPITSDG
jgi:CRISPR/Cas system-associated exonuclease Cas4 (RecB family)